MKPSSASGASTRALVLSPEAPYPTVGGGPLRTASLIAWLAGRYEVDLIAFQEPEAPDPRASIPEFIKNVHVVELPFHAKHVLAKGARNLKRYLKGAPPLVDRFSRFDESIRSAVAGRTYSIGLVEHFWCARYINVLRDVCDRVVLDLHNVESLLLQRSAECEPLPIRLMMKRFAAVCRKLEQKLLPDFSSLLVTSEADKTQTTQLAPLTPTIVYPNAIPYVALPVVPKVEEIVFTGNLDYHPNFVAVDFFHRQIWPILKERWPSLVWRIIGKNEQRLRHQLLGDHRILFTGRVDDAVSTMASARAAVVPVLSGSGTRVKIIEAWAAGLPVVSTHMGAEGLPGIGGEHLLIEDHPQNFARAVSSVLEFPKLGETLGDKGRRLYEAELTWDAAWKRLDAAGL